MSRVVLRTTAFAILYGCYMVGSIMFYGWAMARAACPADSKVCV